MNKVKLILERFPELIKAFIAQETNSSAIARYRSENISNLYEEVHDYAAPVFVLSPGRSGTKYLTKLFETQSNCTVFHKGYPELLHHSKIAFEDRENLDLLVKIIDACRYELIRDAYVQQNIFIETNNKITFFANALSVLFPKSKFIELKRDPVKFVQSGYSRGWYQNSRIIDEGRIKSSDLDYWNSLTQVEKITYLWNETHSYIDDFMSNLDDSRRLRLNSKDLFGNLDMIKEVFRFCYENDKLVNQSRLEKAMNTKVNAQGSVKELSSDQIGEVKKFLNQTA